MPELSDQEPPVDDALAARAAALAAELATPAEARHARQLFEAALGLVEDHPDPLDLKIAAAAMTEMRQAFRMFAPYEDRPKVTVFGSARTRDDDPVYRQAEDIARMLAARGWMVVTGAGPGIMHAAMEGAGRDASIGVAIRLPFETGANPVIAGDEKFVSMRYFFTRKLMLVKESAAFVCLPGGFGTLDETFELLTLTQTGKGLPVPIVLLDASADPFWAHVDQLIHDQLIRRRLVGAEDRKLYVVTDSCEEAVAEIARFYRNYHSLRYVGDDLILRLRHEPTDAQVADLDEQFAGLVERGSIRRSQPLAIERRDDDHVELPRIRFAIRRHRSSDLRSLIDAVNAWIPHPG